MVLKQRSVDGEEYAIVMTYPTRAGAANKAHAIKEDIKKKLFITINPIAYPKVKNDKWDVLLSFKDIHAIQAKEKIVMAIRKW